MGIRAARRAIAACVLAAVWAPAADAASLEARILDADGKPVEDAVLLAFPASATGPAPKPGIVDVDQVDKEFVPHVSAVPVGTQIRFPNYDQIRHHVYSFSPIKTFEIPLYKGIPADPIVFDKPGIVTLGCNIHDWMQGYVLVSETRHTAVSHADGTARLEGVPAGAVRVRVWHPELDGDTEDTEQSVQLAEDETRKLTFEIERKKVWKIRRGGSRGGDRYR